MITARSSVRSGWSLVEVLVVAAIIAVLAGMLLPMVSRLRETTNRLLCANALRQWGMALIAYSADNRGMVPRTPGFDWPAAANWPMDPQDSGPWPNQFSVSRVIEYLPGATYNSVTKQWNWTAGLYLCPSQKWMKTTTAWNGVGSAWTTYCYFGWSNSWLQNNPSNPTPGNSAVSALGRERLMHKRIEGSRILMQDLVVDHGPARGGFHTNHMRGRKNYGTPSEMLGANQLWGDGHVAWKTVAEFDPEGIRTSSGQNFVSTRPPGWSDVYWW